MNTYTENVLSYFEKKASAYDEVEQQVYWNLSDALLWELLLETSTGNLPPDFRFLDAGGGTGRWSLKLLQHFTRASGEIRDISPHMLDQAREKQRQTGSRRLSVVQGSIEDMPDLENNCFDLVFNFHNVIGFLSDPARAIREMARVLKPGGILATLAPNSYHMAFFNLYLGKTTRAGTAVFEVSGTFTDEMPVIKVFTPRALRQIYNAAGLKGIHVYGFPKLIYPGFAETQLHGTTSSISQILDDRRSFEAVLELEQALLLDEEAAPRGNNLFIVGRKPSRIP